VAISLKELGIDKLDVEDRLALVQEIWDTIAVDSADIPVKKSQQIELDRRIADHRSNPEDLVSWDEASESVRKRISK